MKCPHCKTDIDHLINEWWSGEGSPDAVGDVDCICSKRLTIEATTVTVFKILTGKNNLPDKILALLCKYPGTILSWRYIYETCWKSHFDESRMRVLYAATSKARSLPGGHHIKNRSRAGLYYEVAT